MAAIDHLARALHYMDRLALPKNVKKKKTFLVPKLIYLWRIILNFGHNFCNNDGRKENVVCV